jgi:cobalt/nickel transport system permease protein
VAGGMGVALLLAGVLSFFASANPDGLEYVAESNGFIEAARDSAVGGWLLADYGDVGGVPVGVAGLVGVGVTILVGLLLFRWLGRRGDAERQTSQPVEV